MLMFVKAMIMLIPYAIFGAAGMAIGTMLPSADAKYFGAASAAVGVVFGLIDAMFWKVLDGTHEHILSRSLNTRQAIDLRKCISRRIVFLKRRWGFSMAVYFLLIVLGLVVLANAAILSKHPWIPTASITLLCTSVPALLSLVFSRFDLLDFQAELRLIERKSKDLETALADIGASR